MKTRYNLHKLVKVDIESFFTTPRYSYYDNKYKYLYPNNPKWWERLLGFKKRITVEGLYYDSDCGSSFSRTAKLITPLGLPEFYVIRENLHHNMEVYLKPYITLHYIGGREVTKYYNSVEELNKSYDKIFKNSEQYVRLNVEVERT